MIQVGTAPRYITKPIEVTIKDRENAYVGQLAKAVAEANTPHDREASRGIFVVLYTPDTIDEEAVVALREALRPVNGLEVAAGQLGGFPRHGYFWVRLEDAGGAELSDIIKAARKANPRISLREIE